MAACLFLGHFHFSWRAEIVSQLCRLYTRPLHYYRDFPPLDPARYDSQNQSENQPPLSFSFSSHTCNWTW
jgi:hypothetical protein